MPGRSPGRQMPPIGFPPGTWKPRKGAAKEKAQPRESEGEERLSMFGLGARRPRRRCGGQTCSLRSMARGPRSGFPRDLQAKPKSKGEKTPHGTCRLGAAKRKRSQKARRSKEEAQPESKGDKTPHRTCPLPPNKSPWDSAGAACCLAAHPAARCPRSGSPRGLGSQEKAQQRKRRSQGKAKERKDSLLELPATNPLGTPLVPPGAWPLT